MYVTIVNRHNLRVKVWKKQMELGNKQALTFD